MWYLCISSKIFDDHQNEKRGREEKEEVGEGGRVRKRGKRRKEEGEKSSKEANSMWYKIQYIDTDILALGRKELLSLYFILFHTPIVSCKLS